MRVMLSAGLLPADVLCGLRSGAGPMLCPGPGQRLLHSGARSGLLCSDARSGVLRHAMLPTEAVPLPLLQHLQHLRPDSGRALLPDGRDRASLESSAPDGSLPSAS